MLVLTGGTGEAGRSEAAERLMVVGREGSVVASYDLAALRLDAPLVHYFPQTQRAAVVSFTDPGAPDVPTGKASLLDLRTGDVSAVADRLTAVAADPARDRLFLVRGRSLSVVDVETGRSVVERHFEKDIEELLVDASGEVYFLQLGAGTPDQIVALAPPSYAVAWRRRVVQEGEWHALLASDAVRGRIYVGHYSGASLDTDQIYSVTVESREAGAAPRALQTDGFLEGTLFGLNEGSDTLYLHDAESGQVRLYDAETLQPLQTVQDFYGEFVGLDAKGRVLVTSGKQLQRRDPHSFAVLQSVELGAYASLAALGPAAEVVHVVLEASEHSGWTEQRLVQISLDDFRLLP
jgi:hypothetical protein